MGIKSLNAMQEKSREAIEKHSEIILISPTGSGKTLAYLLMALRHYKPGAEKTYALIITPSRELALQTEVVFKQMGTGLKVTLCYGGHKREIEENNLQEAPVFIIGTAGRISDHIRRENIHVSEIECLVLDEFDKSLEMGFLEEMEFIISSLPHVQTKILTSATRLESIPEFLKLQDPLTLDFSSMEKPGSELELLQVVSQQEDKLETLFLLLCNLGNRSTIIFLNHRDAVERTSHFLSDKGITNVFYHGGMEQREREIALCKFRNGTSNFLVTTDLASRGLDIPHIRYIIHYHLPLNEDAFTHRNGRTARMEASGTAILLIGPEESIPEFLEGKQNIPLLELASDAEVPGKPQWSTLFFGAGKKDKLNKVDIVGFLIQKGELRKEDIGLIEVKDFYAFAAIRKSRMNHLLSLIQETKIKNKKIKIAIAK